MINKSFKRIDRVAKNLKSIIAMLKSLISEKKKEVKLIFSKKEDFLFLISGATLNLITLFFNKMKKYEIYYILICLLILFLIFYSKTKNLNKSTTNIFKILMGIIVMGLILKILFLVLPIMLEIILFFKEVN